MVLTDHESFSNGPQADQYLVSRRFRLVTDLARVGVGPGTGESCGGSAGRDRKRVRALSMIL